LILRDRLPAASFCEAYLLFLRDLSGLPVFKYKEFFERPFLDLRKVCAELDVQFDPSFLQRFHTNDYVTGDLARPERLRNKSNGRRTSVPAAGFRATGRTPGVLYQGHASPMIVWVASYAGRETHSPEFTERVKRPLGDTQN
jgi:hypothetical protein